MKRFKWLVMGLVLAISACATTLVGKETQALQAVNATLSVANVNFAAGKMSKQTHADVLKWAEASKQAIDAAKKAGDAAALDAIKKDAETGTIKITDGVVK